MFVASFVGAQMAKKRVENKKDKKAKEKYLEKESKSKTNEKWSSLQAQLKASRRILETYLHPTIPKDQLLPKDVVQNAKGIILLTVYKSGILVGKNIGFGSMIIRTASNQSNVQWSQPVSVGIMGVSHGIFSGGSFNKKEYVFIINSDDVIKDIIKDGALKLSDKFKVCPGPIGRDINASVFPKSDILSYPDSKLDTMKITVKSSTNGAFYDVKDINIKQILSQYIRMPQNDDYDKIIHLLNTYTLENNDVEQKADIETETGKHSKQDEKNANLLHSMFSDIDKEVIKVILIKQCSRNMDDAVDILALMTNKKQI